MRAVAVAAAPGALLFAPPLVRAEPASPAPAATNAGTPSPGSADQTGVAQAPAGAKAQPPAGPFVLDQATTWDVDVEGGVGRYFGSSDRWAGLVRGRAGVLVVRDPVYESLGVSVEYSSLSKATFGVQAEVARIDAGFWVQTGALIDLTARPGALLSGGWSIFGLEGQLRSYAGLGFGVTAFIKVSVPIGIVAHAVGTRSSKSPSP